MKRTVRIILSLALFAAAFGGLCWYRPLWLFEPNGVPRTFGVGYREKTILPIWLVSVLLGLLSYMVVRLCIP